MISSAISSRLTEKDAPRVGLDEEVNTTLAFVHLREMGIGPLVSIGADTRLQP